MVVYYFPFVHDYQADRVEEFSIGRSISTKESKTHVTFLFINYFYLLFFYNKIYKMDELCMKNNLMKMSPIFGFTKTVSFHNIFHNSCQGFWL